MKRLSKPLWSLGLLILSIVYLLFLLVLWLPMTVAGLIRKKAYIAYFDTPRDSFAYWISLVGSISESKAYVSDFDLYVPVRWPESQNFIGRTDCHLINDDVGYELFGDSAYFVPKSIYHLILD